MIFITVGTDHHPFDRLIRAVDDLKGNEEIKDDVFVQKGSSDYDLKSCEGEAFLPYDEMMGKIELARIVITHGGPGSIMPVLRLGKIPLVVPREKRFGEAVDDHQIAFGERLHKMGRILLVRNIEVLGEMIGSFEITSQEKKMSVLDIEPPEKRLERFVKKLAQECRDLLGK